MRIGARREALTKQWSCIVDMCVMALADDIPVLNSAEERVLR